MTPFSAIFQLRPLLAILRRAWTESETFFIIIDRKKDLNSFNLSNCRFLNGLAGFRGGYTGRESWRLCILINPNYENRSVRKVQGTFNHLKLLPLDVSSAFVGVPDEVSSDAGTDVSDSAALLVVTSTSSVFSSSGLSSSETRGSSNFVSSIYTIIRGPRARRRLSICRRTA